MKSKLLRNVLMIAVVLAMLLSGIVSADDGTMFRRNVSKTPDQETERGNLIGMTFYVPAQSSDGTVLTEGIDYFSAADEINPVDNRLYAKPLVAVYIDALPEEHEEEELSIASGTSFGAHDAYAAHSLDDGATWKRTNLSLSADLSSFNLADGHPYPGDAHNMTFAIAGDKVLVGWISKYCDGGSPNYTLEDDENQALLEYEDSEGVDLGLSEMYLRDIWGVAGSQSSIDFTKLGFPEVGEVPYSCVWSARGQLLEVDSEGAPAVDGGFYDIVWTKAERLTSGRRDANRLEMNADGASGFMMTWQEDPEGLRPGMGLGPGEGWSGAVVNQQTDLWYSYISVENFMKVDEDGDNTTLDPIIIDEYVGDNMPKVAVPMAMPIRLTDNKKCMTAKGDEGTESEQFAYCFIDFDDDNPYLTDLPDDLPTGRTDDSTFCATTQPWTTPGGATMELCQAEDGRVLGGRVGSSRPRVNVQPYNSLFVEDDVDDTTWYDGGIVIMGAEESKALGEGASEETDPDVEVEIEDIGKNMWYYSFDLLNPDFVMQGGMLNQPAIDPETSTFFELLTDDFENEFYETEISRRFSHFSQPIHQIGETGVSAVLIVKQGILNQGGPADIFLRTTKVGDDVIWEKCELDGDTETIEQCLPEGYNPYAYENMVCEDLDGNSGWEYLPGDEEDTREGLVEANPRYVQGLCVSNMINVSGGTIVSCDNGTSGADCADAFPWDGQDDIGEDGFPKVTEWVQTVENLDDQSWANPYDVSKGHRGFIDGDFILMMYAWSPNWQANSVGNDHYNLYARRSFDGGLTWTTTPANWMGGPSGDDSDDYEGTTTCENYKDGSEINTVCTTYSAGEFEQSRNLSQLIGNRETILDPRYSPTGGIKMLPITDLKEIGFTGYDDDERDPSKFFIVYETGDNTTVAEGEAVPMDLFYSRAVEWGDEYDLVEYETGDGEIVEGFDWLEHDREDLSGEAANLANNGGNFYYVIWNQWQEDEFENVSESDAIFRRIMYLETDDTESDPTATIAYSSGMTADFGDIVTFAGTSKDNDRLGEGDDIVEYEWTSSIQGKLPVTGRSISMEAGTGPGKLWAGYHTISFRAKDNEGNWSQPSETMILVGEEISFLFMPMTIR